MDLKALIAKMDQIESKKFLVESKDKGDMDHDGKDESDDKEYKDNKDAAIKKAMGKDKDVEESILDFKGAIAQALLKEFGLAEQDPARAQYDKFKADDARADAIARIQSILKPGGQGVERLGTAIDPKTGIIYYGADEGEAGVAAKQTPFKWIQQGQDKFLVNLLKTAGLEIKPVDQKTLFGTTQVAAVDPAALANLGKAAEPAAAPAAAPAAPIQTKPSSDYTIGDAGPAPADDGSAELPAAEPAKGGVNPTVLKRYKELLDKLEGGAPSPVKEQDNAILALIRNM